jgi:hypothetical protein
MANTPVGGPFGDLTISPGVIYDGIDDVYGDGVITVDGYGPEAGGAAENVLIGYDGSEFVAGAAYNTTLSGSSFTDAFGATTEYYATQYVYSGGLALSTTIEFNGSQNLNIGGTASALTQTDGAAEVSPSLMPAGINRAGSRGGNASVMVAAESFERVSALVPSRRVWLPVPEHVE